SPVEPHFHRDVGEAPLAVVMVKPAQAALARHQKNIQQAVIIVVEKGRAAAGGFQNEPLGFFAAVGKRSGETGARGHVFELDGVRAAREEQQPACRARESQSQSQGQSHSRSHGLGAFSPSFFRKSVNSPSGGRLNLSNTAFSRSASASLPALR